MILLENYTEIRPRVQSGRDRSQVGMGEHNNTTATVNLGRNGIMDDG